MNRILIVDDDTAMQLLYRDELTKGILHVVPISRWVPCLGN